jgi:monoamine oxidase
VKVTFDNSPPDNSKGVLMGFIGGHEARQLALKSPAEQQAAALQSFANYFGDKAKSPKEFVKFNWSTEPWTRGCPVSVLAPGTLLDFGPAIRAPQGKIHWAGTETATYWNGYMDGAVRSGERAAEEVRKLLKGTPKPPTGASSPSGSSTTGGSDRGDPRAQVSG